MFRHLLLLLPFIYWPAFAGTVTWDQPSEADVASYDVSMCWDNRPCVSSNQTGKSVQAPLPLGKVLDVTVKPVPVSAANSALIGTGRFREPTPQSPALLKLADISMSAISYDTLAGPNPIDLAAGDPIDWVFWDYMDPGVVTNAIGAKLFVDRIAASPTSVNTPTSGPTFQFTGGYPVASETSADVRSLSTDGHGFVIKAFSAGQRCNLKLYYGGNDATVSLSARLSDNSASTFANTATITGEGHRVASLTFEAGNANANLEVLLTKTSGAGYVYFGAATNDCSVSGGATLTGSVTVQPAAVVNLNSNASAGFVRWGPGAEPYFVRMAGGAAIQSVPRPSLVKSSYFERTLRSINESNFQNTPMLGWGSGGDPISNASGLYSLLKANPAGLGTGVRVSAAPAGIGEQRKLSVWLRAQKSQIEITASSGVNRVLEHSAVSVTNDYVRVDVYYSTGLSVDLTVVQKSPTGTSISLIAAAVY